MIQLQLSKSQKWRLAIYALVIIALFNYYFYRVAPRQAFPFHYLGFSSLPEVTKDKIVWNLDDQHKWGLPNQKPICRDLLATQGYSSFANNAAAWTCDAIDLAEKQGWKDLNPLINKIYERPINIWVFERAFRYIRAQSGKPVSTNLLAAADTLKSAGHFDWIGNNKQLSVSDEQLSAAKECFLQEPDKDAVLVYALEIAGWNVGMGESDRGRNAAADILKSLDRNTVTQRLRQLGQDADSSNGYNERRECDWVAHYLGISLESIKQ